jgi:cell division protein ZipA
MNELRWILLVAGGLLIAGLYFWGMRSRQRSAAASVERTVRVEQAPPAVVPAPAPPGDGPRVEPSLSRHDEFAPGPDEDEPTVDFDEPAISRSHGRREPTLGVETTVLVQRPAPPPPAAVAPEPVEAPAPARAPEPAERPPREPGKRPQQKIVAVRVVANPPLRFEGAKLLEVIRAEGLEFGRYDIFHNLHSDGRPIFSVASLREPGTFDIGAMPASVYPGIALFAVLPGPLPAAEAFDQLIFTARALAAQLGGALADDRGGPLTVHRITRLREDMVAFDRQRSDGEAD